MRTSPILAYAALTAMIAGCEIFAYADRPLGTGGGGSAVTSSGGGGATSGGSGGGGAATGGFDPGIECLFAFDCPGEDADCVVRTCVDGMCGTGKVPDGTPTSKQIAGDCLRSVCDGKGGEKLVADDLDVSIDGSACTRDACNDGVPSNPPETAGAACDDGGGKVCDGAGACVECTGIEHCPADYDCLNNVCVSLTCVDMKLSVGETDVDCGGATCAPCPPGKHCFAASDCQSSVCSGTPGTCFPASCGDGVKNGFETDIDCGGGDCVNGCGAGKTCVVDADCRGGLCVEGKCAPTCIDEEKNADETDADCGGSCPPCGDGRACAFDGDCLDDVCASGLCITPVSTCGNGVKDETESGVDCGGPECPACGVGLGCVSNVDCTSKRCVTGACAPVVLIGEVRTRGQGGAQDELVELYNPLATAITLDASFTVSVRSAIGSCSANTEKVLFTGSGQTLAPHGHFLLGGAMYTQMPAADAALSAAGLPDAGSLVIARAGTVWDALCYAYDAATTANLASCSVAYVCEGTPASNKPHDNTQSPASTVDASLQRKPGGARGSGRDTGSSSLDFQTVSPATPESSMSPPAP